jgi:adenosylcobinamide-GDP ribazoletransferase
MPTRSVRAAFVFLTRIPVGGFPYSPREWQWSSAQFPLVGACIGLGTALVFRALAPAGAFAAALLAIGVTMLVTGAFHEDGLADTSDALGGGYTHERVLAILKDSRVGTFGAVALVVSVVGRAALLARLDADAWWALPLVGCVSRAGPVWQMVTMPYATAADASKSRDVTRARPAQALVATAWAASALAACVLARCSPARLGFVALACAVVTVTTAWRYQRRLGGVTGDFLGATEQLCELAALLVLAWGRP